MSGNNVMFRFASPELASPEVMLAFNAFLLAEVPQRMTAQPTLEEQRMADQRVHQLLREGAL